MIDELSNKFIELYKIHCNGKEALDRLNYLIFNENVDKFNALSIDDQWVIRGYIDALRKIYG